MKKAIIFGTDQFAEVLYYFLNQPDEKNKVEVSAFTVDKKYLNQTTYCGLPVIEFEQIEKYYPPEEYGIFICLGYTKMNEIRQVKFKEAKEKGYNILSYCHPTASVYAESMGEGNIIMENVTIGAFCRIGTGNVFWANAHIAHHTKMGDFNFFTISVAVAGNINIGNNCFFGNNCTIKNGINISDRTLIGAGCYLSKDTEPDGVYVPARSVQLTDKKSMDFDLSCRR